MCGFTGFYRFENSPASRFDLPQTLRSLNASIAHRGPDADGFFEDAFGRCLLGHRRLSIIDLSPTGAQPMRSHSGRWVIAYNGEFYNHREFIPELQAAGIRLRGHSDTEILINLLELHGPSVLERVDGMFAFAAFDTLSGELLLARDAFGEKPLYVTEMDGQIAFASELRALELLPGFRREVDIDAMAEMLMFQYIGAPRCIYPQVRKLPQGGWLRIQTDGRRTEGRHFSFRPGARGFTQRPAGELVDELEELLTRSLRDRLVADVPLGAFLSGGVDSSVTAALAVKRLGVDLRSFSIGFADAPESEHLTARVFAHHLGTRHQEEIVSPDVGDFLRHAGRFLDEPNGDSSCLPTWLLSRFARRNVTVAVSGDGGDELFGGYGRYMQTVGEEMEPGRAASPGRRYYAGRILVMEESALQALFGSVPAGLAAHLERLRAEVDSGVSPLLCRLRQTDVDNYMPGAVLPKVDRMAMQHSLEVRTPFLNRALAAFAERLPPAMLIREQRGKWLLRQVAYRHLPRELIDLPKQGFALPMSDWGKTAILGFLQETATQADSPLRQCLGGQRMDRFIQRQQAQFSPYQVWGVAVLESWAREHRAVLPASNTQTGLTVSVPWEVPQPSIGPVFALEVAGGLLAAAGKVESLRDNLLKATTAAHNAFPDQVPPLNLQVDPSTAVGCGVDLKEMIVRRNVSTVLAFDSEFLAHVTQAILRQWRLSGIQTLMFLHPFKPGQIVSVGLHRPAIAARILAALRGRRLSQAHRTDGLALAYSTDLPAVEVEAQDDHAILTFGGQISPLPVTHEVLRSQGIDRYSVWNGEVLVNTGAIRHNGMRRGMPALLLPMDDPASQAALEFRLSKRFYSSEETFSMHALGMVSALTNVPSQPVPRNGKPRVLLVTPRLSSGGAERQWCYLAIGLRRLGHDVMVVTLESDDGSYSGLLASAGVPHAQAATAPEVGTQEAGQVLLRLQELALHGYPHADQAWNLYRTIAAFKPDAVVAQLDKTNIMAGIAALLGGVPRTVLSFRNVSPQNFAYLRNAWFRPCYQALAQGSGIVLTANSGAGAADYAKWLDVAPQSIHLLPNVVDASFWGSREGTPLSMHPSSVGSGPSTLLVLGAFRLSEEKAPLRFVEVVAELVRIGADVRAFIAGDGPLQSAVQLAIQTLGLERHLTLLGRRSDVAALMADATVLLHTAEHEGTPNVLLEAQTLGLPVVATDAGASAECFEPTRSGFLHQRDDVHGMAASVAAFADPALRASFSQCALKRTTYGTTPQAAAARLAALINAAGRQK